MRLLTALGACFCLAFLTAHARAAPANPALPDPFADANGREIMDHVYTRHQLYPFVYEEQSMILVDQQGNKNTRKLRRYSQLNETGSADFLLLFDSPRDVKGVALLASRSPDGETRQSFYLPAFGPSLIHAVTGTGNQQDNFLGTDYSINDLVGEMLDDYRHERVEDFNHQNIDYYVVDVFALDPATQTVNDETVTNYPLRRHYVRKDSLFISRTDHFDDLGRIKKRQTQHDLTNVHGDMWRANMMMMDNALQPHRTIIKIDRRVFSRDYVPPEVFTPAWIMANQGLLSEKERPDQDVAESGHD